MTPITLSMMQRLWPQGNAKVPGLLQGIVASAPRVFAKYGITSDLVVAHAMAQFSHECGAGLEMVENINYTAARAAEVWPLRPVDKNANRHFADAEDCYHKCGSYAGDPDFKRKLINLVYGTRMGNRPGTDDGYNFIGRGLPQTTGHDGYAALASRTGLDLLNHPELEILPENALECGIADFVICGCVPYALQDSLLGVSAMLNVGHMVNSPSEVVGYDLRAGWLRKWKPELIGVISDAPSPKKSELGDPTIDLHYAQSEVIMDVQTRLDAMGYHDVGMHDGKWGGKTAGAIAGFKNDRHIEGEAVIDAELIAELDKAEAEGFKRAIAPERADATEATVAKQAPEIVPVKRGRFAAISATIGSIFLGVMNALGDYFKDALAWITPMKDFASGAPAWVWFALAAAVTGGLAYAASRGAKDIVTAFRTGERS